MNVSFRGRRTLARLLLAAAAATALVVLAVTAAAADGAGTTPVASGGSILYLKGGKLWLASPDGRVKHRVPHAGTFDNPSQADNGTIVAQRGIDLYRMNRRGRLLNKPITTAFRVNNLVPTVKGPFWPEVSPDGTKIAYTYSLVAEHFDYGCNCVVTSPSLNTTYTYADRFVDDPVKAFGNARMYRQASWIDSSRVLMTTEELLDFAGNVLDTVAVDALGGGADAYERWFSQCDPCDSLQTLKLVPLGEGEMTRQHDKLVFVAGELGTRNLGTRLAIYRMNGMPPAATPDPCFVTGATGKMTSPTWSVDGRSLAWEDAKGIWVGRLGEVGSSCQLTRRLLVPGGRSPDWGPATP